MKIIAKDVLHFYLGCEAVDSEHPEEGLFEITLDSLQNYENEQKSGQEAYIKPLLYPLNKMSKFQAIEFIKSRGYNHWDGVKVGNTGIEFKGGVRTINFLHYRILEPESFLYFINNDFDVFGLIENGQAIDKTTLTP